MTGYERYMATVRGDAPDHLARVPILMQFAAEHVGSNYGEFASDFRVLVEANLACARDFGMDQLSAISDPYRETAGFGAEIEFVRDGVPRCLRPPLADTKDLSRLAAPDPGSSERMLDRVRAVESFRERAAGEYSVMGWIEGPAAEAADLRGVTTFLMDLMDDEPFARELMALCTEVGARFALAQLEAGADTIGMGDAIVSQISPAMYESLVFPGEREMVDAIHGAGGLVRLHICGDITRHLPVVAGLGADVIDIDWQVDMREARRLLGPRAVLAGNLDPASAVMASNPDEIRARVRDVHAEAGDPYMVAAGCEIPSGTPAENLAALCEPVPCE